jgi:hypothetical protein
MKPIILAFCLALAGCATQATSPAQQAENAACTSEGDATYQQDTVDQEARTDQVGQRYAAMPNQVFNAETMGAESQRGHQIQNCEDTGNNNGQPVPAGGPAVTPHILTN